MDSLIAAAVSTENRIGEPEFAIHKMETWLQRAVEQNVEMVLFPELNVSGYVPAQVAGQVAEPVPGPSTEKVIELARRYGMTIAFGLIERKRIGCTVHMCLSTRMESSVSKERSMFPHRNSHSGVPEIPLRYSILGKPKLA